MHSEYFDATIQSVGVEAKEVREVKRSGFLNLQKTVEVHSEDEYFIFCKMVGTDFIMKMRVSREIFEQAKVDAKVSVHLEFKFEYACFLFLKHEEGKNIVTILGDERR